MIDDATRDLIRQRAGYACEYCQLSEANSPVARLQIEHIIPRKHGGDDRPDNLALACIDCNLHKGSNLTGIDPETGLVVELFNPRQQDWIEHFSWNGVEIVGVSSVGRVTVRVMDMNADDRLQVRLALHD